MFNIIKEKISKIKKHNRDKILKENHKKYKAEKCKKAVVSYPPKWITVTITNICNNKCVFCAYHCEDAKGISNVYNLPYTLKFNDFKRIIDMAYKGNVPHVHICASGEPFMNKEILKMMDYSIKVYGKTSLQTNFYKPLFDRFNYIEEILKRKDNISYITTDILSGDPKQHNELKKGSNYYDVMDSMEYISKNSDIKFHIHLVLTKLNYKTIPDLVSEIKKRKIKGSLDIVNMYSYDFNEFSASNMVYTSEDKEITDILQKSVELGNQIGVKVNIPKPTDEIDCGCTVFWDKIQTWPVKGNDPKRYPENLIPQACRAVVKGELNSLGYIFDYDNVMDFWNNEKNVQIRQNLLEGKYPSEECKYCYSYNKKDGVNSTKQTWKVSAEKNLENFKNSLEYLELNENSVCIDCGANVGLVSEVFAQKGAEVHAFEPNPVAFAELQRKFSQNSKVKLYQQAVLDKDDKMKLFMYKFNQEDPAFWSQGASVYETKNDVDTKDFVEVEVVDLISFIKELNKPIDILKIDIEGGEYDILLKLIEEDLYKNIKHILVETHDKHIAEIIPKGDQVREMIKERNIKNINLDWV